MSNQNDLRVIKTKAAIKKAFFDLSERKSFEKITISDIANKAMINRATFYIHYEDKYDLMRSLESEVLAQIQKSSETITQKTILNCQKRGVPFPHIMNLLNYVIDNPRFFNLITRSSTKFSFYNQMGEIINEKMFKAVPELENNSTIKKYIKPLTISIFSSILDSWVLSDMKDSIGEVASLITKLEFEAINLVHKKEIL